MTLTLRPITGPEELHLFTRFPYVLNKELEGDLTAGRRRPQWLWVALRGDRLTARAGWWSRPGDAQPALMDVFDVEDQDDGVRLMRAADPARESPPDYLRFVPPDWRQHGTPWKDTLERTGARLFVERLRLERRPGPPPRLPRGRLRFRPPRGAEELIVLMTAVLHGTLDSSPTSIRST